MVDYDDAQSIRTDLDDRHSVVSDIDDRQSIRTNPTVGPGVVTPIKKRSTVSYTGTDADRRAAYVLDKSMCSIGIFGLHAKQFNDTLQSAMPCFGQTLFTPS